MTQKTEKIWKFTNKMLITRSITLYSPCSKYVNDKWLWRNSIFLSLITPWRLSTFLNENLFVCPHSKSLLWSIIFFEYVATEQIQINIFVISSLVQNETRVSARWPSYRHTYYTSSNPHHKLLPQSKEKRNYTWSHSSSNNPFIFNYLPQNYNCYWQLSPSNFCFVNW